MSPTTCHDYLLLRLYVCCVVIVFVMLFDDFWTMFGNVGKCLGFSFMCLKQNWIFWEPFGRVLEYVGEYVWEFV